MSGDGVQLREISHVQTGPFGSQLHASDYVEHGTPIITVEHLGDNKVLHRQLPLVSDRDRNRLSKYSLEEGDVVFTRVGAIDRRAYVRAEEAGWLFSGRLLRVRPLPDVVDGRYLSYALGHPASIQWILNHAVGSTMACLNTSILGSVPLQLPRLTEQRRIAEILDTLDATIEQTERLIAKLRQMKQGLLHDLLTRGIDDNGELRDPERHPEQFRDSPVGLIPRGWEMVAAADICHRIEVGIVVRPTQYYAAHGVPVLRSANVREGRIELSELKFMSERSHAVMSKSAVTPGDVVTVRTGYPGTTAVVPPELTRANCVDIIISRPGPRLLPDYLATWVNSDMGRGQVLRVQGGLAQQHFNVGEMKTLLVALPNVSEQARLNSAAATADQRLHDELKLVRKLRTLKHGLMHDLLTGRVRTTPDVTP